MFPIFTQSISDTIFCQMRGTVNGCSSNQASRRTSGRSEVKCFLVKRQASYVVGKICDNTSVPIQRMCFSHTQQAECVGASPIQTNRNWTPGNPPGRKLFWKKRSKINFTKKHPKGLNSPRRELANGALESVVTLLVCWEINFSPARFWCPIQL